MTWSRQDYVDTAVARGMTPERAERLADGLMRAHERAREGKPGWERLCLETPMPVVIRYRELFRDAVVSNPTPSVPGQIESGMAAVFGYGVMCGMLLAEHGILPSEIEHKVADQNLPELQTWIAELREESRKEAE